MTAVEDSRTLVLPYGMARVKVAVDGRLGRPQAVIKHMLESVVLATEASTSDNDSSVRQERPVVVRHTCDSIVVFDDITVTTEITFELYRPVSRQNVGHVVFGLLAKIWESARYDIDEPSASPGAPMTEQEKTAQFLRGIYEPLAANPDRVEF